jgi:acyl carrier protein
MESAAPSSPLPVPASAAGAALLRHFPQEVRDAHARFAATGDADAVDTVVLAVLRDQVPEKARMGTKVPDDGAALVADLGLDSIAVTEMVFLIEDLFGVTIATAEIVEVRTVGDLRAFVRRKLGGGSGAPSQA